MKHTALIAALAILALTACENKSADKPLAPPPEKLPPPSSLTLPPGHPATGAKDSAMTSPETPGVDKMEKATVVSTIDVPTFTYIEIKQGDQTRWLAARTTKMKKGDVIEFDSNPSIENFKSKALNRTFPSITFVNTVTIVKDQ